MHGQCASILFYFNIRIEFHFTNRYKLFTHFSVYGLLTYFNLQLQNRNFKSTFTSRFEHVQIHLPEIFPEAAPLGPRVYTFVILIDTTKSPSASLATIYSPTGDVWEGPFPYCLDNKVYYNERLLILIKQISRIRALLRKEFMLYLKTFSILLKPLPLGRSNKAILAKFQALRQGLGTQR